MSWLFPHRALEKKRLDLVNKAPQDPGLQRYLHCAFPLRKTPIQALSFLALDFETTGLDANSEAILSVGYTVIEDMRVKLGLSDHHVVRINREIPPESIVIHGITDDRMNDGQHLHTVMDELLAAMAGRVVLVHYDAVEKNFLQAYCQRQYGFTIPMMMLDTLAIEQRYRQKHGLGAGSNQLRLFNLRTHYGLPRYKAHNAMTDAIATAELFLAQLSRRAQPRLKDLMS